MAPTNKLVFLSYAREDIEAASKLYNELVEVGINVWFDKESLVPGAKWRLAIRSAISESRYFIALMSSRSVSKKGFVQSELRQAIEVLDEFPESETYLIPVRLDACEAPHDRLKDFQWVDLFPEWEEGANKLLRFFGVTDRESALTVEEGMNVNKRSGVFAPTVRVDGVYQSKKISDYYSYLRFYADGLVIGVSSTGLPVHIAKWFNRGWSEKSRESKGIYTVSGSNIKFSLTSSKGTVDHEGEIQGENLVLRSHSHINGYRGVYEYRFAQTDAFSNPET